MSKIGRRRLRLARNRGLLSRYARRSRTIAAKVATKPGPQPVSKSSPRPDRRPERTRKALLGAFIELMLERGYEAVSVEAVTARANIGRSTLYAHFGGLEGMAKQSLTEPSTRLARIVDQTAVPEDLAGLLRHFKDQHRLNRVFFVQPLRALWVRRLAEMIEPRLMALARDQGRPTPALPWGFIAVQVSEGQLALVGQWLTLRSAAPSPEAIAEALISTTRAAIDSLVPAAGR